MLPPAGTLTEVQLLPAEMHFLSSHHWQPTVFSVQLLQSENLKHHSSTEAERHRECMNTYNDQKHMKQVMDDGFTGFRRAKRQWLKAAGFPGDTVAPAPDAADPRSSLQAPLLCGEGLAAERPINKHIVQQHA